VPILHAFGALLQVVIGVADGGVWPKCADCIPKRVFEMRLAGCLPGLRVRHVFRAAHERTTAAASAAGGGSGSGGGGGSRRGRSDDGGGGSGGFRRGVAAAARRISADDILRPIADTHLRIEFKSILTFLPVSDIMGAMNESATILRIGKESVRQRTSEIRRRDVGRRHEAVRKSAVVWRRRRFQGGPQAQLKKEEEQRGRGGVSHSNVRKSHGE